MGGSSSACQNGKTLVPDVGNGNVLPCLRGLLKHVNEGASSLLPDRLSKRPFSSVGRSLAQNIASAVAYRLVEKIINRSPSNPLDTQVNDRPHSFHSLLLARCVASHVCFQSKARRKCNQTQQRNLVFWRAIFSCMQRNYS